jgi:hypothetical protein
MSKRDWKTTLKEEFWRPSEEDRLWVRKRIGWGLEPEPRGRRPAAARPGTQASLNRHTA